jgi:hypothetical protein
MRPTDILARVFGVNATSSNVNLDLHDSRLSALGLPYRMEVSSLFRDIPSRIIKHLYLLDHWYIPLRLAA